MLKKKLKEKYEDVTIFLPSRLHEEDIYCHLQPDDDEQHEWETIITPALGEQKDV